ncbi:MAG: glycosyltransferase family 2 protein [Chthonomonadales bacterium]|nr:glycosyltransferase family 2 protein [Chthonomonadales bacterium]
MPVYNEAATLLRVLERVLRAEVPKEVLIVDDASTDGTRELLRKEVEGILPGVRVLYKERNEGKGAAIRAGLAHARGEWIVIQDGDLEYDPRDYARLLEPARRGEADIVYGSRFAARRPAMRLPNRVINWLLARMVRVLYGAPLTDEATCYKLFRREVLLSLPLACRRFEFCPEVTAKALRRGHRIVEVPIRYAPRTVAEGKKIRWTDGVTAVWTLLRYRFWR